ncbi:MAG: hypothetical protein ACOCWM_01325 [Cyclobacteriaceae bacterium]
MSGIEEVNRLILYIVRLQTHDFRLVPIQNSETIKIAFEANEANPDPTSKGHFIVDKETGAVEEYYSIQGLGNKPYEERFGVRSRTTYVEIKVNFKKQESDNKYYLDKAKINATVELLDGDQEQPTVYEAEFIWITLKNTDTKIKKNASVKKDIFKLDYPYNEDFWKKQNILPLTNEMETFINEASKTDIEKKWTNIRLEN